MRPIVVLAADFRRSARYAMTTAHPQEVTLFEQRRTGVVSLEP
jgi:hypothetical protein